MPRGDGTGNVGMGPMTGRGMYMCAYNGLGFNLRHRINRGHAFSCGRGYGFPVNRNTIDAQALVMEDAVILEELRRNIEEMEREMSVVKARLAVLGKESN